MKLKCSTCRHSYPIAKCAWCDGLFDPTLTYDGREKVAGRPRKFCTTECERRHWARVKIKKRLGLAS